MTDGYLYRTAITRLDVGATETERLEALIEAWHLGCTVATDIAWPDTHSATTLQSAAYDRIRESTGLKSQHAILVCRQVAEAMSSIHARAERGQRVSKPVFRSPTVTYDSRTMAVADDGTVSLTTLGPRVHCSLVLPTDEDDGYQYRYLDDDRWEVAESTLTRREGEFFLHLGFRRPAPSKETPEHRTVLGVDLGIGHLAVTSTGRFFSGRQFSHDQREALKRERDLQRTGTRSAYRTLGRVRERSRRRGREYLHEVANGIIEEACEHDCSVIAFEDLGGIRDNKPEVSAIHRWAFWRLMHFVEYRAAALGIAIEYIDPSYTSQSCSQVGCESIDPENRPDRGRFLCQQCGYEADADYNAAKNIGVRCVRRGHTSSRRTGTGQCALASGTLSPVDGFADKSES